MFLQNNFNYQIYQYFSWLKIVPVFFIVDLILAKMDKIFNRDGWKAQIREQMLVPDILWYIMRTNLPKTLDQLMYSKFY